MTEVDRFCVTRLKSSDRLGGVYTLITVMITSGEAHGGFYWNHDALLERDVVASWCCDEFLIRLLFATATSSKHTHIGAPLTRISSVSPSQLCDLCLRSIPSGMSDGKIFMHATYLCQTLADVWAAVRDTDLCLYSVKSIECEDLSLLRIPWHSLMRSSVSESVLLPDCDVRCHWS